MAPVPWRRWYAYGCVLARARPEARPSWKSARTEPTSEMLLKSDGNCSGGGAMPIESIRTCSRGAWCDGKMDTVFFSPFVFWLFFFILHNNRKFAQAPSVCFTNKRFIKHCAVTCLYTGQRLMIVIVHCKIYQTFTPWMPKKKNTKWCSHHLDWSCIFWKYFSLNMQGWVRICFTDQTVSPVDF